MKLCNRLVSIVKMRTNQTRVPEEMSGGENNHTSHLCSQLLHVGVDLIQQVVALLEQRVLGIHKWQHLCRKWKLTLRSAQILHAFFDYIKRIKYRLTASRISNFFFAWSTLICRKNKNEVFIINKGVVIHPTHWHFEL